MWSTALGACWKYRLVLLTQDLNLARSLLDLDRYSSVRNPNGHALGAPGFWAHHSHCASHLRSGVSPQPEADTQLVGSPCSHCSRQDSPTNQEKSCWSKEGQLYLESQHTRKMVDLCPKETSCPGSHAGLFYRTKRAK